MTVRPRRRAGRQLDAAARRRAAEKRRKINPMRGWFRATSREGLTPVPLSIRDQFEGQVAIVMGTGPSLDDYDLTDPFFTENITIGGNNIGALFQPTYYCMTDPSACRKYSSSIMRCPGSKFLVGELAAPVWYRMPNFRKPFGVLQYDRADRVGKPGTRIYHGSTIGCVMLHVAWLMGFRYIFLIGLDGYGVKGTKHATGNQPVGPVSHDRTVETNLNLAHGEAIRRGRFIFNLSHRSVYTSIPHYHSS